MNGWPAAAVTAGAERARPLSRDTVIDAALRLVEQHGVDALTMRRLGEELGAAVTAIYWHVGHRDTLLDELVGRILAEMGTVRASGAGPEERIASLARSLRAKLLDRPHLVGLAHQRSKSAAMFQPIQAALARELEAVGIRGAQAAIVIQTLEVHVIASVVLQRTAERGPEQSSTGPDVWSAGPDDPELVARLAEPVDYPAVFEVGLKALLGALLSR